MNQNTKDKEEHMTVSEEKQIKRKVTNGLATIYERRLEAIRRARPVPAEPIDPDQEITISTMQLVDVLNELLEGPGHVQMTNDNGPKVMLSLKDIQVKAEKLTAPKTLWKAFNEFTTYEPITSDLTLTHGSPAADLIKL